MAASAMPRHMVSMSSSGPRQRVSRVVAVIMASMQVGAQKSLFTSDDRGFAAHRRILRQTLVQDFASSIRKRRTIEEPTAARQVKARASSGPS
jgi:hypothetical protein